MTPEEVLALLQVVGELAEDSEKFGRGADSRLTQEFYAGRAQALRSVQNLIRKRLGQRQGVLSANDGRCFCQVHNALEGTGRSDAEIAARCKGQAPCAMAAAYRASVAAVRQENPTDPSDLLTVEG